MSTEDQNQPDDRAGPNGTPNPPRHVLSAAGVPRADPEEQKHHFGASRASPVPTGGPDHHILTAKRRFHCTCPKLGRLTVLTICFILVCFLLISLGRKHLSQILYWLETLPIHQSLILFIFLYTIVSFPFGLGYALLNVTAGYIYGVLHGQAVVMISVAIGFTTSFLICRSCLRDWAWQYITSVPTLLAMTRVIEGPHGTKVILLTRLTPVPFGLQNALLAVTDVSFAKVFFSSIIGLLPTQILNTYIGSTVRNMKEVLSDRADGYIILIAQIIFSVMLTFYLLQKARQELYKLTKPIDVESGLMDNK